MYAHVHDAHVYDVYVRPAGSMPPLSRRVLLRWRHSPNCRPADASTDMLMSRYADPSIHPFIHPPTRPLSAGHPGGQRSGASEAAARAARSQRPLAAAAARARPLREPCVPHCRRAWRGARSSSSSARSLGYAPSSCGTPLLRATLCCTPLPGACAAARPFVSAARRLPAR